MTTGVGLSTSVVFGCRGVLIGVSVGSLWLRSFVASRTVCSLPHHTGLFLMPLNLFLSSFGVEQVALLSFFIAQDLLAPCQVSFTEQSDAARLAHASK